MAYKILVALDGSMLAERAIDPAVDLARLREGRITLVQVREQDTHEENLATHCQRLNALGVKTDIEVGEGDPVKVLVDLSVGYDLLVMGSHGRTGFDRFFLGSVTEKVIRRICTPVLVVRAGWIGLEQMKRIMVCLDGSACSHRALKEAALLARASRSELMMLKVVEHLFAIEEAEGRTLDYLQRQVELLDQEVSTSTICAFGSAARTIVRTVAEKGVDLVVLGTHGRSGVDRLVSGSVAENVTRASVTPLLVVS